MKAGRRLFQLHSLLGLVTGMLLLVISLSGSVLVFHEEIDHALNPDLLTVPVAGPRLPLNQLYAEAAGRYPGAEAIRFRRLPLEAGHALEMNVTEAGQYTLLYLDPYTGRVVGERQRYTFLVDWLLRLHYSLFLGSAGEFVVALLAVALLGSVATGLFIYRKYLWKVLLFRVPLTGKNWRVLSSGLHRIVGVWSLLFNVLIAVTGFYLHYPALAAAFEGQGEAEPAPVSRPFRPSVSLDELVARSTRVMPGFVPRSINLPAKPEGAIVLYGSVEGHPLLGPYGNWVAFDALTGAVSEVYDLRQQSPPAQLDSALGTLHFGHYGGIAVKILYALLGLTPAFLSLTGALLWWRRKQTRVRTARRTARHSAPVPQ
jgi:uncharacterized iron-regulated membrane protein